MEKLHRILPTIRSFEVINPFEGGTVAIGSKTEILWQMTGMDGKVFGELWQGNRRIKTIFKNGHGASGKYVWMVAGNNIVPGGNYRIKLVTEDKRFTAESGRFNISQLLSKLKIVKYLGTGS